MKKLESLKLKKFKMHKVTGGNGESIADPSIGDVDPYTYGADYTYNGTRYVTDTVRTDVKQG